MPLCPPAERHCPTGGPLRTHPECRRHPPAGRASSHRRTIHEPHTTHPRRVRAHRGRTHRSSPLPGPLLRGRRRHARPSPPRQVRRRNTERESARAAWRGRPRVGGTCLLLRASEEAAGIAVTEVVGDARGVVLIPVEDAMRLVARTVREGADLFAPDACETGALECGNPIVAGPIVDAASADEVELHAPCSPDKPPLGSHPQGDGRAGRSPGGAGGPRPRHHRADLGPACSTGLGGRPSGPGKHPRGGDPSSGGTMRTGSSGGPEPLGAGYGRALLDPPVAPRPAVEHPHPCSSHRDHTRTIATWGTRA